MILGISCDTPEENRAFRDKFDFPFDLLCDEDRRVAMIYGAAYGPDTVYPERISYLISATGRVLKTYANVVPAAHPGEVLNDLARLG